MSPPQRDWGSETGGTSVTGQGHDLRPLVEDLEAVGLAPEWDQLLNSGLSTELVETNLSSRASSTRKLTFRHQWRELEMIVSYGKTERE